MEWLKAIFAIVFFAGVMIFLPLESIAQVATAESKLTPTEIAYVLDDKSITIEETKTEATTYTYDQLLQVKKQLQDAIASISSKQAQLEQVNLMIAQIEAEKAKASVDMSKNVTELKPAVSDKLTQLRQILGGKAEVVK